MRLPPASLVRVLVSMLVVQLASVHLLSLLLNGIDDSGNAVASVHQLVHTMSPNLREEQKSYPAKSDHPGRNTPTSYTAAPHTDATNHTLDVLKQDIRIINNWVQPRYVCGKLIPPNGTLYMDSRSCHPEDVAFGRIFPIAPSLTGEGMETTVVRFRDDNKKHHLQNVTCDIPCSVWPAGNPTVKNPAAIDGTPFRFVAYSMEGSRIYKSLEVKPLDHYKYQFYATTSFKSDVPLSYYSERLWNIQSAPVEFEASIKGASFLARNCDSFSNRENLVKESMRYASTSIPSFRIDSLSDCLRNALAPPGVDLKNKTDVMRSYLFHFSFENQITEDYISEKLWGALASGTVPIYLGAPNVLDHVPPRSIILVNDFSSVQELVDYVTKLAYNQTLYESYHEWRKHPLPTWFHEKYDFTKVHSHCRVCRFSYALKYGWGWDHKAQQIRPLQYPRNVCFDEQGWMAQPIQETWKLNVPNAGDFGRLNNVGSVDCSIDSKSHVQVPNSHWQRTVWNHDGVTDMEVSMKNTINQKHYHDSILRLQMPVNTTELINWGAMEGYLHNVYWIQDAKSRFAIVCNETMNLSERLEASGRIEIPISRPLRIRLILEDIDNFHEGGDKKESYFGSLMIDEFLHPLSFQL